MAAKRRKNRAKPFPAVLPSDVLGALEELGVEVVKVRGSEAYALCPGHMERLGRPDRRAGSWSVNIETGEHHCWSCGFAGGFFGLVSYLTGKTSTDAKSWVVQRGVTPVVREREEPEAKPSRAEVSEAHLAVFEEPPLKKLRRFGLTERTAAFYEVRWDPRRQHFIIPIRDVHGELLGWQRKGEKYFSNNPRTMKKSRTLFGIDRVRGRMILVESPLDCVRLKAMGFDGGVASFGSEVSEDQVELLVRLASEIVVALDNDSAGRNSAVAVLKALCPRKSVWALPYDDQMPKDPGEMTDDQLVATMNNLVYGFPALADLIGKQGGVTSWRVTRSESRARDRRRSDGPRQSARPRSV